ncbi:MAG: hypothetical protein HC786_22970 [Richelia sp. CSU_2_1]|nr:hypothetical protein [Richelia sp. CSU_2_1]
MVGIVGGDAPYNYQSIDNKQIDNCQLSTVNCQLSTVNKPLSKTSK